MKLLTLILVAFLELIPGGPAYFKQLQQRDSILIADQFEYGFTLEGVEPGTGLAMSDFETISSDTLTMVRNWQIDTLKIERKSGLMDLKASVVFAPFEEGEYELPAVAVARIFPDGRRDTLSFESKTIEVKTMPVDTATFVIKDIKGQMTYPVTFKEVLPWAGGGLLFIAIVIIAVYLIRKAKERNQPEVLTKESAYIVALRELDKFRGDKFWAPEKQKVYYSGVTDILKNYIDVTFGIDAPEMTTAELFAALKVDKGLTPELYEQVKDLFEVADFVKFAKYNAADEQNAKVLPTAVRFVTSTYQAELEEEQKSSDVL